MRTFLDARKRNQSAMRVRVAGAVTSRSICSDQSAVPNEVQTRSVSPVASMVMVVNGCPGLRRTILERSVAGGSACGQTLSSVTNMSAYGEDRPWRWKSWNSALCREMWLIITSSSTSWRCGDAFDVIPRSDLRIDLAIGQGCEATVGRRRERGQDVDAVEQAGERAVEERGKGPEIAAE